MTYKHFEREILRQEEDWSSHCNIEGLWKLAKEMLSHIKEQEEKEGLVSILNKTEEKKMEKEILMKTRGVYKYVTSCYYKDSSSTKNALVQVGYLDLNDNMVFNSSETRSENEPDTEFVESADLLLGEKPDTLVRYLPGFMVRGYRSCEEYVPITNSHNGKDTKEINEVISQNTIQYSPSTYSSSPKVPYSVIGYLNDDGELIYYNQIANKE